ncbi:MAG TPA: hypothetical protein DCQ98_17450 [Planctomycetaceae bacterium]|nr:hypothetical protein [Planctomycetaceae bacterium]
MDCEPFRARDFVITEEGLALALVLDGPIDGKLFGTLRYRRDGDRWVKLGTHEGNRAAESAGLLQRLESLDVSLPAISPDRVVMHLEQRRSLSRLIERAATNETLASMPQQDAIVDPRPARLARLVEILQRRGIPLDVLGITGSLLIGAVSPAGDIDLTIRGTAAFDATRRAVHEAIAAGELQSLSHADWRTAWERRGSSLTFDEYRRHQERKGTQWLIDGTKVDLSLALPTELPTAGRKIGRRTIRARILDDRHAFALPARWQVEHAEITEILTWTATFTGQVRCGETCLAIGTVERTTDGSLRLLIGADREAADDRLVLVD